MLLPQVMFAVCRTVDVAASVADLHPGDTCAAARKAPQADRVHNTAIAQSYVAVPAHITSTVHPSQSAAVFHPTGVTLHGICVRCGECDG